MVIAPNVKVRPLKSKLRNDLQRFEEKVVVEEELDCWLWTGNQCKGYGMFRHSEHNYAHRFSYTTYNQERIPDHLEVDHICQNSLCVNPDHLRLVTPEDNISNRRMRLFGSGKRSRTACKRNHPYSDGSFYINKDGYRICRECARLRDANKRAKKKSRSSETGQ